MDSSSNDNKKEIKEVPGSNNDDGAEGKERGLTQSVGAVRAGPRDTLRGLGKNLPPARNSKSQEEEEIMVSESRKPSKEHGTVANVGMDTPSSVHVGAVNAGPLDTKRGLGKNQPPTRNNASTPTPTSHQRGLSRTAEEREAKAAARRANKEEASAVTADPKGITSTAATVIQRGLRRTAEDRAVKAAARKNKRDKGLSANDHQNAGLPPLKRGLRRTEEEREAKAVARSNKIGDAPTSSSNRTTAAGLIPFRGLGENRDAHGHARTLSEEEKVEEGEWLDSPPGNTDNASTESQNDSTNLPNAQNVGLVEANPVESSRFDNLEVAELMDPSTNGVQAQRKAQERKKTKHMLLYLLIGGLVLLGIAIGLVVFFTTKKSSNSEQDSEQVQQTSAPSMLPTLEKLISALSTQEKKLISLLPLGTQAVILTDSDATQPQSMAYKWMLDDPNFVYYLDARLVQRFAMATLYYSTEGQFWQCQGGRQCFVDLQNEKGFITKEEWLDYESHECNWFWSSFSTMCPGDNQTVEVFKMVQNYLAGTLPPELGLLSSLRELEFYENDIGGVLVTEIGLLGNLSSLRLEGNWLLHGSVPSEIGLLTNSLKHLSLTGNRLNGTLPSHFWKLSRLVHLDLSYNQYLRGTIPSNLGEIFPQLMELRIQENMFSGSLPSSVGQCTALERLIISGNDLTGVLPTELGVLTNLWLLLLENNFFTGTIPSSLCDNRLKGQVGVAFDCSPALCGCTDCPCSSFNVST